MVYLNYTEMKEVCEIYVSRKMHREPFDKEKAWRTSHPLELMYTDVCRPMCRHQISEFLVFTQCRMNLLVATGTSSQSLMIFQECVGCIFLETSLKCSMCLKKIKAFVELQSGFNLKKFMKRQRR